MTGKIHFVSLLCVDFDMDLFHHWAQYYRHFDYDSYYLYFHTNKPRSERQLRVMMDLAAEYGFNSSWVFGPFKNGELREKYLGTYHNMLPKDDYLVTADSDEFHEIPEYLKTQNIASLRDFKNTIRQYDAIEGYLVDCWGKNLNNAEPDKPLKEQYPNEKSIMENSAFSGIVAPNRLKIMAAKCSFNVNYSGSHCIFNPENAQKTVSYTKPEKYRVLHYTFRASLPYRMAGKRYYKSKDLYNILSHFGISDHPALRDKMKQEDRMQEEMGWIPAVES